MNEIEVRFQLPLNKGMLDMFDEAFRVSGFTNKTEYLRDLIRKDHAKASICSETEDLFDE